MVTKIQKFAAIMVLTLLLAPSEIFAFDESLWKIAEEHAKPLEAVLIDGPYYVSGRPYLVFDYMLEAETKSSLVYDPDAKEFVRDAETLRRVLATRDLALLTLLDPLFYALGDPSLLELAAKYEAQNARNFAEFVPLSLGEMTQLELFLQTYEDTLKDISKVSRLTGGMLYPGAGLDSNDEHVKNGARNFSYEGFQELAVAYDAVSNDYFKLVQALQGFSMGGGLRAGTPIREKWGVIITDETLRKQLELIDQNGDALRREVTFRKDILSSDYRSRVEGSRLETDYVSAGPKRYLPLIALFVIVGAIIFYRNRRPPLAVLILALTIAVFPLSQAVTEGIPTLEDLLSKKVNDLNDVGIKISASGIDEARARRILQGYPLLFKGEDIEVRGPVYVDEMSYYIFEITKDGKRTGDGFLVGSENELLLSNQHTAFQAVKALSYSELVSLEPLYAADPKALEAESLQVPPPLQFFLANLSLEVRKGRELETRLTSRPSFATARELAEHYMRTFVLLRNIRQVVPEKEADARTQGMASKAHLFERYSRSLGLSSEEYLAGRIAMYRGRTLNRIPLMRQLSLLGMQPSSGQLLQDLASDFVYDNYFLWHVDKVKDPNLFARLAFKEGTETLPSAAAGENFTKTPR